MAINDPTTNFGWDVPDVGGDSGAWGTKLNELIAGDGADGHDEGIDEVLGNVKTTADAALPKSGGDMSGKIDMHSAAWDLVDKGSSISGTLDLDLSAGNFFHGTLSGNVTTVTFSNVPAGGVFFVFEVDVAGFSITWPSLVKWPGGADPTLTGGLSGVDVLVFYSRDEGTTVRGALAMSESS